MSEATPRPIVLPVTVGQEVNGAIYNPNTLFDGDGNGIAQFYGISMHRERALMDSFDAVGLARIDHVAKALNAHDDVIAAMEAVVARYDAANANEKYDEEKWYAFKGVDELRAALAKARGEK